MIRFIGVVVLADNVPATLQELIQVEIRARNYPTPQSKEAAAMRLQGGVVAGESFLQPDGDIQLIDAFKGTTSQGVVDVSAWTLPGDIDGHSDLLAGGVSRHVQNGTALNEMILYQHTGAAITAFCDISIH